MFSGHNDFTQSEQGLSIDFIIIKLSIFQWKIDFKRGIEICISGRIVTNNLRPFSCNQSQVKKSECCEYQGLILDTILTFKEHLYNNINKGNIIIASLKKLYVILPGKSSVTIPKLLSGYT